MKYLLCIAILFVSVFYTNIVPTNASIAVAQDVGGNIEAPSVDFLNQIQTEVTNGVKSFQERLDNVDNAAYYEKWEAKDAAGKTKTIKDLNEQQLRGFFIFQAEILHQELTEGTAGWKQGLGLLKQVKVPEPATDKKSPEQKAYEEYAAVLKDTIDLVDKAIDSVHAAHKKLAQKRESMISDMIYLYKDKDKDLVKELTEYLEKVKIENESLGLVDREVRPKPATPEKGGK